MAKIFRFQWIHFVLMLLLCLQLRAFGSDSGLSIEFLTKEALANNPEIKTAEQQWKVAKEEISPSRTLPDPMLTYSYQNMIPRQKMYGIKQSIPFPTKLGLRGSIAETEAEMREQELQATKRRVIAELKEAFYELCLTYKTRETLRKNEKTLLQLKASAEAHYKVGHGVQQDLYRAQTELSRLQARLAILEQRKVAVEAVINRILNRPVSTPLGQPQEVRAHFIKASLDDLIELLAKSSPMLIARQKIVQKAKQGVDLARSEFLPDFEISGSRTRDETMGNSGYQFMVGMSVPLFAFTKQQPGVRAAKANVCANRHSLQTVRQELMSKINDLYSLTQRAKNLIGILTDAIIPQAELTLSSAFSGYSVGKVDFLSALNSLITLQENEIEWHMEVVEHEKARARLEEIVGEFI